MVRDVFVKASIINLAWSKVQIFLTPHVDSHYDLDVSIEECFNKYTYTDITRKILGFHKYGYISAKDNERMWRASEVVIDYGLSIASHLNRCNYYEKQIQIKRKFASVIGPSILPRLLQ